MNTQDRTCHFCNAKQDSLRPVGRFIVELQGIEVDGIERNACQSCFQKIHLKTQEKNLEKGIVMKIKEALKKLLSRIVPMILFMIVLSTLTEAQSLPGPPVFPSTPSEAPIDGGLGLLAAAGGAYAWKKLRDKKVE